MRETDISKSRYREMDGIQAIRRELRRRIRQPGDDAVCMLAVEPIVSLRMIPGAN
jgi:hypothetical protein